MERTLLNPQAVTLPAGETFTIEEMTSAAEMEEWQAVDLAVWPGSPLGAVPIHLLVTHGRYGGLLLGARDAAGKMIGILLGFPGAKAGQAVHCSHLLGVLPEWQGRDVGYHLKRRQREWALAHGYDLVVWTFDPLETRNARLNIAKLGGIVREYSPNLYGVGRDGLNVGLETDRFTISWHIRHPTVAARLAAHAPSVQVEDLLAAGIPLLTRTDVSGASEPYPTLREIQAGADTRSALVEAPANFQAIKGADLGAARAWREGLRAVFPPLFAHDLAVLQVLRVPDPVLSSRCYYLVGSVEDYLAGTWSLDNYVK
ncbi:MAG: GNAT family N-acetyltransferase [Chloroflexota bacterium]